MRAPNFTFDQLVDMMQQNINHVKNTRFWNKKSKKQTADIGYATLSAHSPRRHACLVQHLKQQGFTVHAPPSYELFQKACEHFNDNAMCLLRECPPELLKDVIMVEIKDK